MRSALTLVLLALLATATFAQPANTDCANAALLCAGQQLAGTNSDADEAPGFCQATDAMVWYTFTTNSVGGDVSVSLSGLECVAVPGVDNEISMVVLTGDGNCVLDEFGAASTCEMDSLDFMVTAPGLAPLTQYWVLIAGAVNDGALTPAQCEFALTLSGPGADIVGVDMSAGPDVAIGQGESTQLQGIGGPAFDWSPTAGLSGNTIPDPIAAPEGTTNYTLTSEIDGCVFTDDVLVSVVRLVNPPNTFTPNDDGYNDTWEIPGIADYPGAEVVIHDRWGQVVLRSNGYREPWDGTNDGRRLSVGTYYYHIQLNQLEGRSPPYTGFVTIVR
ncbi:MAG: gliding motility-associated C-terminal domain-containing protein [Flavobacteriales bacterium]|nr:gliding motility-associated C-terminal domain-containing protein [Flavobacteriales bacterium]